MQAIPLGNSEFEGLNDAYLFTEDDSVALVDTAIASLEDVEPIDLSETLDTILFDHV